MSNFFADIGIITWVVLGWLSIYFIANIWIFLYRFLKLSNIYSIERGALDDISRNHLPLKEATFSYVLDIKQQKNIESLHIFKIKKIQQITAGLSMLSIISSTAPFIGLFGTVVEILEAFYHLGGEGKISFDIIAPIISKALIATAFGILTAIPAYSFYIVLKRKAYEIGNCLDMQIDMILSMREKDSDTKITLK